MVLEGPLSMTSPVDRKMVQMGILLVAHLHRQFSGILVSVSDR